MTMLRKLLLAAAVSLLACAPAHAQKTKAAITSEINSLFPDNTVGAITPLSLRTVTTDIVNSYIGILDNNVCTPTAVGAFPVWNGSAFQCSTTAASTAHLGATSDLYDFWIARPSAATGYLLQMQYGKPGNLATGATNYAINFQGLFDAGTGAGLTYGAASFESHIQAGTNGSALALNLLAVAESANTQPGAAGGANGFISIGKSLVGGDAFGGNPYCWTQTTAARSCVGMEADTDNRVNGTTSKKGIQIVDVATSTGTVTAATNVGLNIMAQTGAYGYDFAFKLGDASNQFPIRTGGSLFTSAATNCSPCGITSGFDLTHLTFSSGWWVATLNNVAWQSFNAAGSVLQTVAKIDASDNLNLYNALVKVSSAGQVTVNQNASPSPSISAAASGVVISLIDVGTGGHQAFSYGAQANNVVARANGTGAAPTKVLNTNNIGSYFFGGFFGTTNLWINTVAGMQAVAVEDWNDATHLGTSLKILTTPAATGANAEACRFHSSGGLSCGLTTDPGIGKISANVGFVAAGSAGLATTKTVRASGGAADCTLIFTGGILTGGSC